MKYCVIKIVNNDYCKVIGRGLSRIDAKMLADYHNANAEMYRMKYASKYHCIACPDQSDTIKDALKVYLSITN